MTDPRPDGGAMIGSAALGRLMPMHVGIASDGRVTSIGPTLQQVMAVDPIGRPFFDCFTICRPAGIAAFTTLYQHTGRTLRVVPHAPPEPARRQLAMRGLAVPAVDGGLVMNLSFGINLAPAVHEHGLTDGDFAPTDLATELLCLIEVMSLALGELRALNLRLQGAKTQAEKVALTDPLTGLANRRALELRLAEGIARGEPFGLINIDLDFFKRVNDGFGHTAGDAVLRHVAAVLRRVTREQDLVARTGGDEFVIHAPGVIRDRRLVRIGRRIIDELERPLPIRGMDARISASIGTIRSTQYARPDAVQMLADADAALYRSKRAGRGRVTTGQPAVSTPAVRDPPTPGDGWGRLPAGGDDGPGSAVDIVVSRTRLPALDEGGPARAPCADRDL